MKKVIPIKGKCTKIFLIRHASTPWKKFGFLSGTDVELDKKGIEEAKGLGLKFKGKKIDAIFSSPSKRTLATANEIAKRHSLDVKIREELREVDFGIFEGLSLEEAKNKFPRIYKKRKEDKWNYPIPKGESYKMAYDRVKRFLEIIKKNYKGKTVLIVTHATLIKLMLKSILNKPLEEVETNYIKEASCIEIDVRNYT